MRFRDKAAVNIHDGNDWCHVCGGRHDVTLDLWYPENAEHDPPVPEYGPGPKYLRICDWCLEEAISGLGPGFEDD